MTVTEGAGHDPAPHPYAHVRDIDDGTWWHMIQPGSRGYGIIPWITNTLDGNTLNWIYQTNLSNALLSVKLEHAPAFVEWQSAEDGLWVELTEWWCYDKLKSVDFYEFDFPEPYQPRSQLVNAQLDPDNYRDVRLVVPAWNVTPVDAGFYHPWLAEAQDFWETLKVNRRYDYAQQYSCICDGYEHEDHVKRCECRPDEESCAGWSFQHFCEWASPADPVDYAEGCNSECTEKFVHANCDCGFESAFNALSDAVESSDCRGAILTHTELFHDTWVYAVESYYRGWNRCAQVNKLYHDFLEEHSWEEAKQRKDLDWYSSLWHQLSPFWQSPGPVQLELMRSPRSTASATRLAS